MTELQEMMLAICFGMAVGWLIGNLISIILFTVSKIKEKRRKRRELKNTVTNKAE